MSNCSNCFCRFYLLIATTQLFASCNAFRVKTCFVVGDFIDSNVLYFVAKVRETAFD